jgi:hypothetical protein
MWDGDNWAVERSPKRSRTGGRPVDPAAPKVVDPLLARLYAYWQAKRGGRPMPARADIDPLEMRFILGHVMLLDVLRAPQRFRVRLQGTEFLWWVGREMTGFTLDDAPKTELGAFAARCLASVAETAVPYHWIGRHELDGMLRRYEAIIMPLAGVGEIVDMLLVGIRCRGRFPGR